MESTTPQIGESRVRFMQDFLRARAKEGRQLHVLEWGAGGSTVFFSKWLQDEGINATWTALEYDSDWYEKVRAAVVSYPKTDIVPFRVDGNPKARDTVMDDYVAYPGTTGKKYDLIFVDGRKRRRCVLEAKKHLVPGGIVLLHDAWRPYYFCALKTYPTSRFIDKSFWCGSLERPSAGARIRNTSRSIRYMFQGRSRYLFKRLRIRLATTASRR